MAFGFFAGVVKAVADVFDFRFCNTVTDNKVFRPGHKSAPHNRGKRDGQQGKGQERANGKQALESKSQIGHFVFSFISL